MRMLDETIGDIYSNIVGKCWHGACMNDQLQQKKKTDLENDILRELVGQVSKMVPQLLKVFDICGELDWYSSRFNPSHFYRRFQLTQFQFSLLALAAAARKYNMKRPQIAEDNSLFITGGRHLLVEMCVDRYISNDVAMCPG